MSGLQFNATLDDQVHVSPDAQQQLLALVDEEDDIQGVRIFVSGGGCDGMTYGMTFVEEPTEFDCVKDADGLNIYIDSVALHYLSGVEIDYTTEGMNKSFVFKNVFSSTGGSGTCGSCGAAGGGCG